MTKEKVINDFNDLGLNEHLVAVLEKNKITKPTEIQKRTIPFVLEGRDVVGLSATGSGKTLAFSAGILEQVEPSGVPQALILTPTRELAEQIANAIRSFALKKIRVFAAYGGVNIEEHMKKIHNADVIVATPGRLLDLLDRGTFSAKGIQTLVFDEFDRMLDMGFHKEIHPIVKKMPAHRQTMLFSATKSEQIEEMIEDYTDDAVEISVAAFVDHTKLEQMYYKVENKKKYALLVHLLRMDRSDSLIIFCSTRLNCDFVSENLNDMGMDTMIIHGGIDQRNRGRTLKKFHKEGGILVCTDVAARGLDINNVNRVYNYDMPRFPEDYIHRVGRTARAGKEGSAITIVSEKDDAMFNDIMKIEGVQIKEMDTPKVKPVVTKKIKIEKLASGKIIRKKETHHGTWASIDDPALSKRFKKKTVGKYWDDSEEEVVSKNKSRTNGSKRRKRSTDEGFSASKKSKNKSHISAKGKKKKRGRAGNPGGKKKVSRRPKGRSNNRSKK
jgi:ATP-dependent RNA helicase DeaD